MSKGLGTSVWRLALSAFVAAAWIGSADAGAATFTVTSTGDGADALIADGICNDGSGSCTLRAAIETANATAGLDTIAFSIGSGSATLTPASQLPSVSDPVTIDGTTQPGFSGTPLIEIDGSSAGAFSAGLFVSAPDNVIRGLVVNRFYYGILVYDGSSGNTIEGNYLGTDVAGTLDRGNEVGILVQNAPGTTIGGTTAAARNVVSGNSLGIWLYGAATTGTHVLGNHVGVDATGSADLGNSGTGVAISFASGNTIGGLTAAARNVISGNDFGGIQINGAGATGNLVQGNYIGTNAAGSAAVGNGNNGVWILFVSGNTVGGAVAGAGNVIAGNPKGVEIAFNAPGNAVQGNYIGTNAAGTAAVANGTGIEAGGASTVIGGVTAAARNVVSGNTGFGVVSYGAGSQIRGNYVGVAATGLGPLGNGGTGISAGGAGSTVADNVVAANAAGISVFATSIVRGNAVGTDAAGTLAIGNSGDGITVFGAGNQIGGTAPGAPNTVAHNGGRGVTVFGTSNEIRLNSIFANGNLGIDLGADGVTANDTGDADTGPNQRQNFPTITHVTSSGGTTVVTGTLNSTPSSTFTLDFYANASCDASGNGEGEDALGTIATATDASGDATFVATFPATLAVGDIVTATATSASGDTSELSGCAAVKLADLSVTKSDAPDPVVHKKPLVYTLTIANAGPSNATNVVLTDVLPASVMFTSASPSQGTCSESGGTVTCSLGAIAAGGAATVSIKVVPTTGGVITNTASVTADEPDPDTANNTAVATTTVHGPPHPAPGCKPKTCG